MACATSPIMVSTGGAIRCRSAPATLGRIMDVLGNPVDEGRPDRHKRPMPIHRAAPDWRTGRDHRGVGHRHQGHRPAACRSRAERLVCSAALAWARRSLMMELIRNIAVEGIRASRCSPASVNGPAKATTSTTRCPRAASSTKWHLVWSYGQMNEPPGNRLRVGLTGLTMAEHFRVTRGRDVLLFVDSIYRYTLAGTEVSALLGRMPSAVGYQPTLAEEMGVLQERITSTKTGSITSFQAVYVPADDLTDPSPATCSPTFDATPVLSRRDFRAGDLPGGGPARLDLAYPRSAHRGQPSTTRNARGVQGVLQRYKAAGHHRHPRHGRAVWKTTSWWFSVRKISASCRSRSSSPRCLPVRPASMCR